MSDELRVSAVQMASGPNVSANLLEAGRLIKQSANAGSNLVVLPENFAYMGKNDAELMDVAETEGNGPIQEFLLEQARKYGIWLIGGTMPMLNTSGGKLRAASLVIDPDGVVAGRYDKMHLFDVHLEEADEEYNESAYIEPGNEVLVIETPFGKLGVAICYDLRFPELFRSMLDLGAEIIVIPAAFTAVTGRAHWETLVRARAIENLAYVIAAAQGGYHVSGRETYGHSMVVDPWGLILGQVPRGTDAVTSVLDLAYLKKIRRSFPVIQHRRFRCS